MNKRLPYSLLVLAFIGGCSSNWNTHNAVVYRDVPPSVIDAPIGKRHVSDAGEIILHSWPLLEHEKMQITSSATVSGRGEKKHDFVTTLKPSSALLVGKDRENARYFESEKGLDYLYGRWRLKQAKGGIVIPNGDKPVRLYWHLPENPRIVVSVAPETPINYSKADPVQTPVEFEGFGQTITYLGQSGGQLNFVYREFDGRTIRSAFTQEFSFDYVEGKEYGYKGARFVVHSATDSSIEYTESRRF